MRANHTLNLILVAAVFGCLSWGQANKVVSRRGEFSFDARSMQAEGPVIHLRGNAKVDIQTAILYADEIDLNADTGDVTARGDVHMKLGTRSPQVEKKANTSEVTPPK